MAPEGRARPVLLPEMTKLHRVEQSKLAHQKVSRAERTLGPTTLLWGGGGRKGRWGGGEGYFFLSSSSYI
jgi:hypothetical protein